ncbi:hypothetical protein KI387_036648, partial [Taxus chinensis]
MYVYIAAHKRWEATVYTCNILAGEERGNMSRSKEADGANAEMEIEEGLMGSKVRRRTSLYRQYHGDYLNVKSNQNILNLLHKQGDRKVLFADNIVKVIGSGKIKRQVLLISDVAAYLLDAQWGNLKRRIALKAVEKVCLSELSDNFFAIIVPTEYDTLLASSRKTEIVTVLVEAIKKLTDNPLEVVLANRFEYYAASDSIREMSFEEVE